MPEEIKSPPQGEDTAKPKSAEELMTDLKKANETLVTLQKQVKDKEEFIGKQSTEIGELRKKTEKVSSSTTVDTEIDPEDRKSVV